jgi:hypothetical protein
MSCCTYSSTGMSTSCLWSSTRSWILPISMLKHCEARSSGIYTELDEGYGLSLQRGRRISFQLDRCSHSADRGTVPAPPPCHDATLLDPALNAVGASDPGTTGQHERGFDAEVTWQGMCRLGTGIPHGFLPPTCPAGIRWVEPAIWGVVERGRPLAARSAAVAQSFPRHHRGHGFAQGGQASCRLRAGAEAGSSSFLGEYLGSSFRHAISCRSISSAITCSSVIPRPSA